MGGGSGAALNVVTDAPTTSAATRLAVGRSASACAARCTSSRTTIRNERHTRHAAKALALTKTGDAADSVSAGKLRTSVSAAGRAASRESDGGETARSTRARRRLWCSHSQGVVPYTPIGTGDPSAERRRAGCDLHRQRHPGRSVCQSIPVAIRHSRASAMSATPDAGTGSRGTALSAIASPDPAVVICSAPPRSYTCGFHLPGELLDQITRPRISPAAPHRSVTWTATLLSAAWRHGAMVHLPAAFRSIQHKRARFRVLRCPCRT